MTWILYESYKINRFNEDICTEYNCPPRPDASFKKKDLDYYTDKDNRL